MTAASAHHSAAASYEADESITITGTVLEFSWTNPHGHVYVDVTEGPFKGQTYTVELSSPGALAADGWTKDDATAWRSGRDARASVARRCGRRSLPELRFTINGKTLKPPGSAAVSRREQEQ